MSTTPKAKGQAAILKQVREAMDLSPASLTDFAVNPIGEVLMQKTPDSRNARKAKNNPDRFEAARGTADLAWRTKGLMTLLRA